MEIIQNNINEQEIELLLTIPWEMIAEEYNDILKNYTKLTCKGFRPGKAPVGAIESFFKNEIKDDLISATSTRFCRTALKEKDLTAGNSIEISEVEISKNNFLRFKIHFIQLPEFDLPDYHRLNLESMEPEDKLNEISEKLLEQTSISLHHTFIDAELKYIENASNPTPEDIVAATERVKLMMILKKIAKQDRIEIDEKDIDDRIILIAQENEVTPKQLKDFFITNNGLSRLSDSLLAESVLDYIINIQD